MPRVCNVRGLAATSAVFTLVASSAGVATPASANEDTTISEIAYAGASDTDFIELAAPAGTDLSGWTVGAVTRGGTVQGPENRTTLAEGTQVGESGYFVVRVPVTNSVSSGSAADGDYGASAFVIDDTGAVLDFDQVGGVAGGRGVTAGSGTNTPESLTGQVAEPTGTTSPGDQSIQETEDGWEAAAPTPGAAPGETVPTDPPEPTDPTSIPEIQGTDESSPLDGDTVTTSGIVTAAYPTGGLEGFFLQTPGTGDIDLAEHNASEGIFVYSPTGVDSVEIGDHVRVTGEVSENFEQTQISAPVPEVLSEPAEAVKPAEIALPQGDAAREPLEGMLLQPTEDLTVSDNYSTNQFGEVGLATGEGPLRQPTDLHRPGSPEAQALAAENADRFVALDDGASFNYTSAAGQGTPVPYLSLENPLRVGESASFRSPVVLGFGYEAWRLQPLEQLTGEGEAPATFTSTRPDAPGDLGGDISLASLNMLNFFTTTGDSLEGCRFYLDREGNPLTVRDGCDARGAANAESLDRQRTKLVAAINEMDTSILSLEEVENSARFGQDRDAAVADLVESLNADAGSEKWDYVRSPEDVPASEDVIRTAFIYQPAEVRPDGDSVILDDAAFDNARQPLAQAFLPADAPGAASAQSAGDETILAIVNHFKSKGSGEGPGNEDTGDGQGFSNADRVAQATALVEFAEDQEAALGTENTFLIGDFNSYSAEDPLQVLEDADYVNLGKQFDPEANTYLFDGLIGSLDHVFASPTALENVTDAAIWAINSRESVALEYSRFNTNVTPLFDTTPFRASDHDPLVVGVRTGQATTPPSVPPTAGPTPTPTDAPGPSASPTEPGGPGDGGSGDDGDGGSGDRGSGGDGGPGDDGGAGGGSGGGSDDSEAGGSLPRTGGVPFLPALLGATLAVAGAVSVILTRRKRAEEQAEEDPDED